MIEEHAQVVAIDNRFVWVEAERQSSCSRCAANKGCGNAVFQKLFGNKQNVFPVANADEPTVLDVEIGDQVVIGVEETALVNSSMMVYLLPIVTIIVFALIGETFAKQLLSISNDLSSILGALLGLVLSVVFLRWYNHRSIGKNGGQPVLLRRVCNTSQSAELKILG